MKNFIYTMKWLLCLFLALTMISCASRNKDEGGEELRLGRVQKDIKVGMSSSEVVEVLGSPNMVTMDGKKGEVWIYDRVSTTISESSVGGGLIFFFGSSSESAVSQKSFTVIIKFDNDGKVKDLSYHSSKF